MGARGSSRRAADSGRAAPACRRCGFEEIPLGDHYTMVKTHGTMRLEKIPGQPIDLVHDAVYILFIKDGSPTIVFTLTHEDPMKMAQEQGLLPANP